MYIICLVYIKVTKWLRLTVQCCSHNPEGHTKYGLQKGCLLLISNSIVAQHADLYNGYNRWMEITLFVNQDRFKG